MATAVVGAAISVLLKALGPVVDPVLEAWAASKGLGANVKALKTELLYVKAVLEPRLGREIRNNSALEQLLWNLQDLAYDAEDVLDELDYFRIQDELHGTVDAVDEHPNGCCCNHVFHVIHTAKDVGRKIGKAACTSAAATPSTRLRAHNAITSSPQADGDRGEFKRCMPKITAGPRKITRAVGKCLPCSALSPVNDDDDNGDVNQPKEHAKEIIKLEFNRVDFSKRIELILQQLQPMRENICKILGPVPIALDSNQQSSAAQSRRDTTSESIEPKLHGRDPIMKSLIYDITLGKYSGEDLSVLPIVGPGGIGKTALAQHIYHSQQVLQRFDVKVWVCVSLN